MEAPETQQLLLQHVRQLDAEVAELKRHEAAPLTDSLAHWLAAQLVTVAKKEAREPGNGCIDLKTLRALNADVVALRHGDHCAERLKVECEWLELETEKFESQKGTKLEAGLDALVDEIKKNPFARQKFKELKAALVQGGTPIPPNPTND